MLKSINTVFLSFENKKFQIEIMKYLCNLLNDLLMNCYPNYFNYKPKVYFINTHIVAEFRKKI